jgi:hypothetical protein
MFVGTYYAHTNYRCIEGPILVDLVNSGIIFLSSFWVVTILATIGMKFASMYKTDKPLLIRGYVWLIGKISRSLPYKLAFHGAILAYTTLIPLMWKIQARLVPA